MERRARMIYYSDKDAGESMTVSNDGFNKVERDGKYGKRSDVDVVIGSTGNMVSIAPMLCCRYQTALRSKINSL